MANPISGNYNKEIQPVTFQPAGVVKNTSSGEVAKTSIPSMPLPPSVPKAEGWEKLGMSAVDMHKSLPEEIEKILTLPAQTPSEGEEKKTPPRIAAGGKIIDFTMDDKGLKEYKKPDGTVWTRQGNPDRFGVANWTSNRGTTWMGKEIIHPDGTHEYEGSDGIKHIERPDGKEEITRPSDNFLRLFEKNFSRLDKNRDGFVSGKEIDRALQNGSFSGEDAELVNALKNHWKTIEDLSNDEYGPENNGVSLADARKLQENMSQRRNTLEEESNRAWSIKDYGINNFSKLDSNGNGYITSQEIDRVLQDTTIPQEQRKILEDMKGRAGEIQNASNDEWGRETGGITRKDLEEYYNQKNTAELQLYQGIDNSMVSVRNEVQNVNRSLFADNTIKSITPEAIRQGGIGDCYFLAALASVAKTNPQSIMDMIKDNGDGTYTVTFPGVPDEPIRVSAPTDVELTRYAHGGQYGMWPALLEKAYGTYCNSGFWRRNPLGNLTGSNVASEGGDGGKLTSSGLAILTGKSIDSDLLWVRSYDTTHSKLESAMRDKRPVAASTPMSSMKKKNSVNGIVSGHVYSVMDYNPQTRTVTLRNPWGGGEPQNQDGTPKDSRDDGTFTLTLEEFTRSFFHISYVQ